ncbi:motility associated factor glycosyltransferase family protein [Candidatus Protochlamydia phocaeensis]|uniref:motility associated factor glycosyltransferase family protein n=1 Tax=Candidatus Protochlamydia phocaeensis TaxID=1414722 RepID=UPI000839667E|nr:6-hydroxymethylpterin diphosphokinase MptE-like protein [Candidatus Protochlamydia phocaeensis]
MKKDLQSQLTKNLAFLQKIDSKLAFQLQTTDPSDVQFCRTEAGELNLKREYEGQTYFYHSPLSAKQEARDWFESLNLQQAEILYIYGIGLGYYYAAAKEWLKEQKNRMLIFLEEDIAVLHRLFETETGSHLLKDPQVQLVYFQDMSAEKALFNELSWTYFASPFEVACLKLYQDVNPSGFLQLHHQLSYDLIEKRAFVDEYFQYGVPFFRNFYPNLFSLPKAYLGNGLFNQFSQVPAIICGAGPSLNKNIELLKTLTDRALLFAGSSALNALIPKEIIPHFGVAIDPNRAQVPRVAVAAPYHVPFFYRNRLFQEALQAISGPRLYLTGTGGYDISTWFEEQLGIEEESLDEGHNVVNFCIEIAHALGCDPIILVGVDLAFTDQQHYADGIIANLQLTEEDFKTREDFDSQPLLKEDIHGKPIYTLWKWITESEWIAEFAKNHPEVSIINATEGGLGFKGIPNLKLQEAANMFLRSTEDFKTRIHKEIEKHSLSFIQSTQLIHLLRQLQNSLDRCIELFNKLIQEGGQLADRIQKGLPVPESLQTPAISLLEADVEEQIGYQYLIDTFNQIYIRAHHRTIQNLRSPKRRLPPKKRLLETLALQKERLNFLRDVARVNRELIQRALDGQAKQGEAGFNL